ncbi:hypothetical protein QJQ45_014658, partial [Haematococcus lacustris]
VDRPPEPSQAQRNMQANGAAHWAHTHNNTWHAKKSKMHKLMSGVSAAGLEEGAVVPSEVVEARLHDQLVLWVEACSKRALLASLLLGLMVRGWFTRVTALADGLHELLEEIPAEDAVIPNLAERNLYLQLGRGAPPPGVQSRPSLAVVAVLAAHPGLRDELNAVPRYPHDSNTVDDVGQKLETSFANSLTELFKRRVGQAVALAGARVIAGSHEHQRRFGLPVDGRPAWTERQRSWVVRSVRGKVVTWLEGQGQGQGGVVPTEAMRDEVTRQRRLLGVGQGVVVNKAWRQRGVNRGSLLRHAVDISRQLESAHVSWQADWADWQALGGQPNSRPYRPPSPFALTPSCSCKAHHIKLDTKAICGLMRPAGMLPADITSLTKFRNGVAGPKDSEVANRWLAFLPNRASLWPNDGQTFAQVVHTDGVTVSVLFTRPKPAGPPDELPRMGKQEGAVNPLAHLAADWLGCDPGKTNMATVAHEERHPSGAVESVWQRSLTAGQYYRQSGITQHAKVSKAWMAGLQAEHTVLSQVTNYTASLQRYREFRLYRYKQRTVARFWAETVRGARVRCNSAATGRPLALAYGAAGFSGSGSRGGRGVPVNQMLREACKQFPGRVVMVDEFRTSRVSSARTNVVAGQAESFRWLRPVRSMAKRSRIRGLMCSTSNGIRFYDRDVSAALNIRRIAAGPGRPRELSSWLGRPAMPNPGRPGQEWVCVRDRGLQRKWQRRHQRQRHQQTIASNRQLSSWLPNLGSQEDSLQFEKDTAEVSMERHGRAKQLVVFFGAASIGTWGGWGADAVLRACCKVVGRPRGSDQLRGRVVLVDEHRPSWVISTVNGQQPCEIRLSKRRAIRPANWKPPAGQVDHRFLCPAWSQQRDQPVRGLMWCPVVAPRKPPQPPCSSQAATQLAASEPGPSTPPPAKRSKRTKVEPAAEPTQPTKGKGKGKGKAAKAKPAPQPGRWLDRDCNAALNMQRIGESSIPASGC